MSKDAKEYKETHGENFPPSSPILSLESLEQKASQIRKILPRFLYSKPSLMMSQESRRERESPNFAS